jgi:hypothetical protein
MLPVEEPNVRICAFHRLAVQLEDQTQHSVRSGVLRSKIQLHVPEACHSQLDKTGIVFISVMAPDPDPFGSEHILVGWIRIL